MAETNNNTLASKRDEEKESLGQGEGWKRRSVFKLMDKLPLTSLELLVNCHHLEMDRRGEVALSLRVYLAAWAVCTWGRHLRGQQKDTWPAESSGLSL